MYKCVDEKGVTHYTDGPRPGCKGREVDIRGQPPVSGKLEPRREDLGRDEAEFKRRHQRREAAEEREQRQQLAARCRTLRSEHEQLMYMQRRYVTDDSFKRRVAQVEHELRACR
jgi:hypothetical protein